MEKHFIVLRLGLSLLEPMLLGHGYHFAVSRHNSLALRWQRLLGLEGLHSGRTRLGVSTLSKELVLSTTLKQFYQPRPQQGMRSQRIWEDFFPTPCYAFGNYRNRWMRPCNYTWRTMCFQPSLLLWFCKHRAAKPGGNVDYRLVILQFLRFSEDEVCFRIAGGTFKKDPGPCPIFRVSDLESLGWHLATV